MVTAVSERVPVQRPLAIDLGSLHVREFGYRCRRTRVHSSAYSEAAALHSVVHWQTREKCIDDPYLVLSHAAAYPVSNEHRSPASLPAVDQQTYADVAGFARDSPSALLLQIGLTRVDPSSFQTPGRHCRRASLSATKRPASSSPSLLPSIPPWTTCSSARQAGAIETVHFHLCVDALVSDHSAGRMRLWAFVTVKHIHLLCHEDIRDPALEAVRSALAGLSPCDPLEGAFPGEAGPSVKDEDEAVAAAEVPLAVSAGIVDRRRALPAADTAVVHSPAVCHSQRRTRRRKPARELRSLAGSHSRSPHADALGNPERIPGRTDHTTDSGIRHSCCTPDSTAAVAAAACMSSSAAGRRRSDRRPC